MWKDSVILFAAIITGVSSLWMTLAEWDNSNYVHIHLGSFRGLATLTFGTCFVLVGSFLAIGKCFGVSTTTLVNGESSCNCILGGRNSPIPKNVGGGAHGN